MYVLCKLLGTGMRGDPYRVGFPSYALLAADPLTSQAIADVRPEDVPPDAPTREVTPIWGGGKTYTVAVLGAGVLTKWQDLIRKRYQETHSAWDPQNAVEP